MRAVNTRNAPERPAFRPVGPVQRIALRTGCPAGPSNAGRASQPKPLDRLTRAVRSRHYSRCTQQTYCHWGTRVIFCNNVRHPAEMAEPGISATHVLNRGGKGVNYPVEDL